MNQKTIAKEVSYSGVGLHTGEKITITFKPAVTDNGISFIRTDLGRKEIKASLDKIVKSERESTLKERQTEIHTVEHLLAALSGLSISNLIIEINGPEPPVGDGSALCYLEILSSAGIVSQSKPWPEIKVASPIKIREEDQEISIYPDSQLKITYTIDYEHQAIKDQTATFIINEETFKKEIAPARTFGFLSEVRGLRSQGLGLGGSLGNTVIIGRKGVINKESLRFEDEPLRHKILDILGDFSLLGASLKGHIKAVKSGHALNIKLAKKILEANKRGEGMVLNITEIQKILPHRYPFLLIDRVLEIEEGKRILCLKNISINEEFFKGHFPDHPVMPGVLIIEAMAQAGGILVLSQEENKGKIVYFMGIDKAKFRRPVFPGDQLHLEVKPIKIRSRTGKMEAYAYVDSKLVAEAEITFAVAKE